MISYETPMYALFGIVFLILWTIGFWKLFKKPQIFFPARKKQKLLTIFRGLLFVVGVVGNLYITYSLTSPRMPIGSAKGEIDVKDIFFVVDVSRSMYADDFYPNRLEVAKKKIIEFIDMKPSDRIGIIIFSESVFTLLPLTTDLELIKRVVSTIDAGFLGSGTNIGDALALGVLKSKQSVAKSKVIIFLTDGVSNVGTIHPLQAAEEAKKENVKVYTIGIGGKKDAKIPLGISNGKQLYQGIPGGSIDLETLNQISHIANGKSYFAGNENALKSVFEEISHLEKSKVEAHQKTIFRELYHQYLFIGLAVLLFVELVRRFVFREGL